MLTEINKSDITGRIEAIEEYLVMRVSFAYIVRKTIIVQTYDDFLMTT